MYGIKNIGNYQLSVNFNLDLFLTSLRNPNSAIRNVEVLFS